MAIKITLDTLIEQSGFSAREIAGQIGITEANLSLLRRGHVRGVRFSTLDALCAMLKCQPGDILSHENSSSG